MFFFFQAEDGIRDYKVTGFRRVLFRSFPTLCWLGASDEMLHALAWGGAVLSLLLVAGVAQAPVLLVLWICYLDRKSTRLNSSHLVISYAVFCLKKKKNKQIDDDRDET